MRSAHAPCETRTASGLLVSYTVEAVAESERVEPPSSSSAAGVPEADARDEGRDATLDVDVVGRRAEAFWAVVRFVASFAFLLVVVSLAGWLYRAELTRFGNWFVAHFGVLGMSLGSFLADAFHFPVPPQFYLFTGIAGGHSAPVVVLSVLVGSELGGLTAFALARSFGGVRFIRNRVRTSSAVLARWMQKRGYLGLALATLLPISFSILCIACGTMRLPYRAYGVLAIMRVPRILASYALIVLAWTST